MTDSWDGRPENPKRSGPHAIDHPAIWHGVLWWSAGGGYWIPPGSSVTITPKQMVAGYEGARYLGPALLPSDLAARDAATREKALREAAKEAEAFEADIFAAAILALIPQQQEDRTDV